MKLNNPNCSLLLSLLALIGLLPKNIDADFLSLSGLTLKILSTLLPPEKILVGPNNELLFCCCCCCCGSLAFSFIKLSFCSFLFSGLFKLEKRGAAEPMVEVEGALKRFPKGGPENNGVSFFGFSFVSVFCLISFLLSSSFLLL